MRNTRNRRHQKNPNQELNAKALNAEKAEGDVSKAEENNANNASITVNHPEKHQDPQRSRSPDRKHHQEKPQERPQKIVNSAHSHPNPDARDHPEAANADASSGEKDVGLRVKPNEKFKEIYNVTLEDGAKRLGTKNLTPGKTVYNERLVKFKGVEYRVWDAFRSKLAGAIIKGLQNVPIEPGFKVLYLGAASGTTPSHVSDIVGETGYVYCVEFAQRSLRDLVNNVAAFRSNISPMLEDARMPERYAMFISGKVDTIYCDVAQPEQAKLLADNADVFLKPQGWVMLACKSQSVDVTMAPEAVYKQEAGILRKRGFDVKEIVPLDPYDKLHAMIVAQKI
jgi:fibrillarin-like pre-rRNA processing protein